MQMPEILAIVFQVRQGMQGVYIYNDQWQASVGHAVSVTGVESRPITNKQVWLHEEINDHSYDQQSSSVSHRHKYGHS